MNQPANKTEEKLVTCPGCGTENFTPRGIKAHKCKGVPRETGKLTTAIGARMRKPLARKTTLRRQPAPTGPLQLDPKILKPHPLLGRSGMLPDLIQREEKGGAKDGSKRDARKARAGELQEELSGIEQSVADHGIKDVLKVCKDKDGQWLILDGRHRTDIALKLKLPAVPCKEYPLDQARDIIMAAAVRRHITKGAKAYQAVCFFPEVAKLKPGTRTDLTSVLNTKVLAKKIGVSLSLVEIAVHLFKTFEEREDAREHYEASIYAGVALAKVKCAVASFIATGKVLDEEEEEHDTSLTPLEANSAGTLICYLERLRGLEKSWGRWESLLPDARKSAITLTVKRFKAAPEEVRQAVIKALKEGSAQ